MWRTVHTGMTRKCPGIMMNWWWTGQSCRAVQSTSSIVLIYTEQIIIFSIRRCNLQTIITAIIIPSSNPTAPSQPIHYVVPGYGKWRPRQRFVHRNIGPRGLRREIIGLVLLLLPIPTSSQRQLCGSWTRGPWDWIYVRRTFTARGEEWRQSLKRTTITIVSIWLDLVWREQR